MIELWTLGPDDWPTWRALRLEALADAPEAFGARLVDWLGAGDSERRWRERLSAVALNLIASLDQAPAGMASGACLDGAVELLSLWVAPFARGRGVGDSLVEAVVRFALTQKADHVRLDVRAANRAAVGLYLRHGFADAGPGPRHGPDEPPERRMVRPLRET